MRTSASVLSVVLTTLLSASGVFADTIVLTPTKDNTLYESATGNLSNGVGRYLFVGKPNSRGPRRALLQFDVASCIPPGSTINSATLSVRLSRTRVGNENIDLHRVLADWGEGNSNATGAEGQGTAAQTGDATWLHTSFNTSFWASPGGDFTPTVSASATVGNSLTFVDWGSTPQLVADVQSMLDDPSQNFGWILIGREVGSRSAKRFDSKDAPSNQPILTVDFTPDCLSGAVNSGAGAITDVFFINGSSGTGPNNTVTIPVGQPITYNMIQAPLGPATFKYVLWVWLNCPNQPTPLKVTGADVLLGCTVSPTPLDIALPGQPRFCIRAAGTNPVDCRQTRERNGPAEGPWMLTRPGGFPRARTFKLQGLIEDNGASNVLNFSVTNCITMEIVP